MRLFAAGILLLLPLFISCGQLSHDSSEVHSLVLDRPGSRWPDPKAIPVCTINREEIGDELFEDLRSHVVDQYKKKTGVGFVGWNKCRANDHKSNVIRVYFNRTHSWDNSHSVTAGGGLSQVGRNRIPCTTACFGATMRLDVGTDGDYPKDNNLQSFIVSRSRATAVHEFGHALGLMHEHERSDAPDCNRADGSVASGHHYVTIGSFDEASIMNYCHAGDLTTLSRGDIQGIYYLYPELASSQAQDEI